MNEEEVKEIVRGMLENKEVDYIEGGDNTFYITNDKFHLSAASPKLQLEGTETGASNLSIREVSGATEIYDEDAGSTILTLESHQARHISGGADELTTLDGLTVGSDTIDAHQARHASGGADEISGISASQMLTDTIKIKTPIHIADSKQSGLDAATSGVKWTSDFVQKLDPQNISSTTIRASWTASETDSMTAVEVYDETASSVLGSVSGNTGTDAEGTVSGFTAGNPVVVRANIIASSATSGATTDINYAVLEPMYSVS